MSFPSKVLLLMRRWAVAAVLFSVSTFSNQGAEPARAGLGEPRVDFLVPGFTATRLPVKLTNADNVEYGPDGKLYVAGYDGRVHVLEDENGDGIEEKVTTFWDKPGDLLTPLGIAVTREGVYIAVRGKIALLRDTDGDGRADVSEVVASNWVQERHNSANRNDASGVALDHEGNLYFSLGCADYTNPFLLDTNGVPHYSLGGERGTILRVSPDRKQRQILVTGIRFGISLQFNRHGDLFATDQEGDTWFPGGNVLDELLHVIPGRHYGFPFRHSKYLPSVIDEPAVAGFGPQHQSTCGFRFNEEGANRKPFGPEFWEGDAIVTGFSRGKLWRVPLTKTAAGYVGKPVLFASFNSLPADVAISPKGDLVVAAHSGLPDWGSGPKTEGYLFKIRYSDPKAPQPVVAWAQSPLEVRVAFDRPISPETLRDIAIETGEFVREGDRFELIRPGYKVVKEQQLAPEHRMKIAKAEVLDDKQTVKLTVSPHPWQAWYAVTLNGIAARRDKNAESSVDLSYTLNGIEASWTAAGKSTPEWQGWIPHADFDVTQDWTRHSAEHKRLFSKWNGKGTLRLRTKFVLPGNEAMISVSSDEPLRVQSNGILSSSFSSDQKRGTFKIKGGVPVLAEIELQTKSKAPHLAIAYRTDIDPLERPLPAEAFVLPWAPEIRPGPPELKGTNQLLIVGDPKRGREIFFSEKAQCSKCHSFRDEGGKVGPDLTVSLDRDPTAVLRDIVQPNAAINPDFVSVSVELKNGNALNGIVQSQDEKRLVLLDSTGASHSLRREEIAHMQTSALSLMPEGLESLGQEALQDLLAFLCKKEEAQKK